MKRNVLSNNILGKKYLMRKKTTDFEIFVIESDEFVIFSIRIRTEVKIYYFNLDTVISNSSKYNHQKFNEIRAKWCQCNVHYMQSLLASLI